MPLKTKTIRQKINLRANPKQVYEALMDSKKHSAFTGDKATIGKKEGAGYSAYSGYIKGKNVKLVPGKKIIQTWKATDEQWPKGHDSEVTFEFAKSATGTQLIFTHKKVPASRYEEFRDGWKKHYWEPLKKWLGK